jgi:predicted Zn-dependent protease
LLNDGETAIGAFGRAHALAADDPAAAFDYASALVRAGDSGQVRMGELLLRDLHQRQPNSLPVLEMLALSAVRNEDYPEAVAALQALLARLPEGDARREAIVRQLAQRSSRRSNCPAALNVGSAARTVRAALFCRPGKAAATRHKIGSVPAVLARRRRLRGPTKGANRAPNRGQFCRP